MLEFFFERVKFQHGAVLRPHFTEISEDVRRSVTEKQA